MNSRSILAAVENEGFFDLIREAAPEGSECVLAGSGASLLAIAREEKPDLILIDQDLPGEGCVGLCRRVRAAFPDEPLQILLLSTSSSAAEACIAAGFDEVLMARSGPEEYRLRLRTAFQRLSTQEGLVADREYYRDAVRREESLSSQLLDEHVALKETLHAISQAKRSLESANRRLEKAATRDSLSGLLNRASLFERMRHEMTRADAEEGVLSGILVDIDHFKTINDSCGHLTGDAVIREIGERMRRHLRAGDHAGRYGGEEFFLVLPGTDAARAAATAERIREAFAAEPFAVGGTRHAEEASACEGGMRVTGSFGVAERQRGESIESWIERVDRAMYKAKQSGRDRVCGA